MIEKSRAKHSKTMMKIMSWMGILGFLGLLGFMGLKDPEQYSFFSFFSFFGFYWMGKLGLEKEDERLKQNIEKGISRGFLSAVFFIFLGQIILPHLNLTDSQKLNFYVIIVNLGIAIATVLSAYLTYYYDRKG